MLAHGIKDRQAPTNMSDRDGLREIQVCNASLILSPPKLWIRILYGHNGLYLACDVAGFP